MAKNKHKDKKTEYMQFLKNNKVFSKTSITNSLKSTVFLTCLSVIGVLLILVGNSYALFTSFSRSSNYNYISIGTLQMEYTERDINSSLNLNDALPISDDDGLNTKGYEFALKNTGTLAASYTIKLVDDSDLISLDGCVDNLLSKEFIKVSMNNATPVILADLESSDYVIVAGTLQPNESVSYTLKAWIDANSDNSILGTHYHGKLLIDSVNDDTLEVLGTLNEIILNKDFIGENGDVDTSSVTETFVVGDNPNNYVWYSGKLWRAFSVDTNGNVKLVSDEIVTVIPFGNDLNYAESNVATFLKNFGLSLRNETDYVNNDYSWNINNGDSSNSFTSSSGMLYPYEWEKIKSYVDNVNNYGLLNYHSNSNVSIVDLGGNLGSRSHTELVGIRPVIVMKNDVRVIEGEGKVSNPYRLVGDNDKYLSNVDLNKRYSGEYVNFSGSTFRIVGIYSDTVKLVSVDNVTTMAFDDNSVDYENSNLYSYLNNTWFNSLDSNYKKMVTDASWFKADVSGGNVIGDPNSGVNGKVGILYIGEAFNSWISNVNAFGNDFYTLSYNDNKIITVNNNNNSNVKNYMDVSGVRVSLYLKDNTRIISGIGTKNSPFNLNIYDFD